MIILTLITNILRLLRYIQYNIFIFGEFLNYQEDIDGFYLNFQQTTTTKDYINKTFIFIILL